MNDERNPKFEGVLGEELDRIWKAIRQDKINSSPSVKATRTPSGTVLSVAHFGVGDAPGDPIVQDTWGFSTGTQAVNRFPFQTNENLIVEVEAFVGDPKENKFSGRTKKVLTLECLDDAAWALPVNPHGTVIAGIRFPRLDVLYIPASASPFIPSKSIKWYLSHYELADPWALSGKWPICEAGTASS